MRSSTRRGILFSAGATAGALLYRSAARAADPAPPPVTYTGGKVVKSGRLKQSVSRWCYGKIPLPDLCKAVKAMGLGAVDLLGENEWAPVRDAGLICSMAYAGGGSIPEGWNDKRNHDKLVKGLEEGIPKVAKFGWPNVITFYGNHKPDITDPQAFDNCVEGLDRVKAVAEQSKVTICVELLNSKVNHKGYQGDHADWTIKVLKAVNSPRVKLLYDIYHAQIMDGDVIHTIRDNKEWMGHYHTGGVPGRHEIDDSQELNWRTVAKAIVDTGYTGYFAHEFIPTRDPLTSLKEAIALCDV